MFKKKKHEKQRLLSDDYDEDEENGGPQGDNNSNDFFSAADAFDLQPKGADFDSEFEPTEFDPSEFKPKELASTFEADPKDVDLDAKDTTSDTQELEDFEPENFQPKDLGVFGEDEPFELVIKDLDKERELREKGEDTRAATMLVDFPSGRDGAAAFPSSRIAESKPEPGPEAAPKKGRRMRRFSLGSKPVGEESENKSTDNPLADEFDGFNASFSALPLENKSHADGDDGEEEGKKKKGIGKIFRKGAKEHEGKKPVGYSAEIVVDKSKIPTQKVAPEIRDGELLVSFPQHDGEEEQTQEKGKSSRFKSLKNSLKKKVGRSTKRMSQNVDAERDSDEGNPDNEENIAEQPRGMDISAFSTKESDSDDEMGKDSESLRDNVQGEPENNDARRRTIRTRRSRASVSGGAGPAAHDLASQAERRERNRRRESRVEARKTLRVKSDGHVEDEPVNSGERRHRHSANARPRRQTLLEKHQASTSGHKYHHGPPEGADHEEASASGSTATESHSENHGEDSTLPADASARKSGRYSEGRMSDSSRGSRLDVSPKQGRQELMQKVKSRRRIDPLSVSAHHRPSGMGRRMPPADLMKRRAMSTRKIGGIEPPAKDTLVHTASTHKSSNTHRSSMSDAERRKRLSRQFISERNIHGAKKSPTKKNSLEQPTTVSAWFSDGLGQVQWSRNSSSHHSSHKTTEKIEEENDEKISEADDFAGDSSEVDANATVPDTNLEPPSGPVSSALASGNPSEDQVEKLIRDVGLQAKNAKSKEDLEGTILCALKGHSKGKLLSANSNEPKREESLSFFQDESCRKGTDENNDESPTISRKEIHEKTREYVQTYQKQDHKGDYGRDANSNVDGSERSTRSSQKNNLKNNYAAAFMNLDAVASKDGEEMDRSSRRDDSRRGSKAADSRRKSSSSGSKHADITAAMSKLEETKARRHEIAKARAKTQAAK